MATFPIPNISTPLLNQDGTISRVWFMFLGSLSQVVGGPAVGPGGGIAPIDNQMQFEEYPLTNPDAEEALRGIDELRNALAGLSNDGQALRAIYDELSNALAGIRGTDDLRARIEDLTADAAGLRNLTDLRNRIDDVESLIDALRPAPLPPSIEQFIAPTLLNSWVNFGGAFNPVGYFKEPIGIIHLRGIIKSGTMATAAFVLPVGYRPANTEIYPCVSNGLFAGIQIDNAGNVLPEFGTNTYITLDGITFRAA